MFRGHEAKSEPTLLWKHGTNDMSGNQKPQLSLLLGAGREGQYCGAERSCMWELIPLASSIHPSVGAFARTLLAGAPIVYDGDPLRDLSLTSFLDKFVARKPKVGKGLE
jgi:hypothetical protein